MDTSFPVLNRYAINTKNRRYFRLQKMLFKAAFSHMLTPCFRLHRNWLGTLPEVGVGATHGPDLQVAKWQRMIPPVFTSTMRKTD